VAPVTVTLEFLSSILPNRGTNTMKGYVSAISSRHAPVDDCSFGSHPVAKGLWRSKEIIRSTVPVWDLDMSLSALKSHPFEPPKFATWKTIW
jgi:hypothetical protein